MIKVLFFAGIKEEIGAPSLILDQNELTIAELKQELARQYPQIQDPLSKAMYAVNEEFADETTTVKAQDEVAVIPPVSGG